MQVAEFNAPSSASSLTDLALLSRIVSASELKQPPSLNLIFLHFVSSASITYSTLYVKGKIGVIHELIELIEFGDLGDHFYLYC